MKSASNIHRLIGCPTSFALPQVRESGEYAERGNILHEFCRTVGANPECRAQALLDIEDEKIRATAAGIDLEAALDGIMVVARERAFVLNVKTQKVRIVGDNIHRKYGPLEKYEVPATQDVTGFVTGTVPCELDWKSGQSIGKIADHWQRRVNAVVLMLHYETPTAISRVGYIWEDGSIHSDGHEFSSLDIDDFCNEIVAAWDAADAAVALLATGVMPPLGPSEDNCKYCPAFSSCPFQTNFAKAMLGELQAVEKGPDLTALTPEQWGRAWGMMKQAMKIGEKLEKAGKLAATSAPLIDGDYEIKPKWEAGRMSFDASKARGEIVKLLQAAGADDEAIAEKLKSLHVQGASFAKFPRTRRAMPVA